MEKRAFLFEKWLQEHGLGAVLENPSKWNIIKTVHALKRKGDKAKIFDPMATVSSTPQAMYDPATKGYLTTILKALGMGSGVGAGTGALTSVASDMNDSGVIDGAKALRAAGIGAGIGSVSPFIGGELGAFINKLTTKSKMGKASDAPILRNLKNTGVDYTVGGGYNAGVYAAPVLAGLIAGMNPNMLMSRVAKPDKAGK